MSARFISLVTLDGVEILEHDRVIFIVFGNSMLFDVPAASSAFCSIIDVSLHIFGYGRRSCSHIFIICHVYDLIR